MHPAVLREHVAAGLVLKAGVGDSLDSASLKILDPMAGSGTLGIEALLIAKRMAPGLHRFRQDTPSCVRWPDAGFDECWSEVLGEAEEAVRPTEMVVMMNDSNKSAINLARSSLQQLGILDHVYLSCSDITRYQPPLLPNLVLSNPSWQKRLQGGEQAWKALSQFLKGPQSGTEGLNSWVLSGNPALTKHLKMKASKKMTVVHGGIDLRWLQYHVLPPKQDNGISFENEPHNKS